MELRGIFLDPTMSAGLTAKFPRVFRDTEVEPFSKAIKDFIQKETGKKIFLIDGALPSPKTGQRIRPQELRELVYYNHPLLLTFYADEQVQAELFISSRTDEELLQQLCDLEDVVDAIGQERAGSPELLSTSEERLKLINREFKKRGYYQ